MENIKKARRTMYNLMSSGLHGENGLDTETSLHIYQIYVLPVLLYGIEVVFPRPKFIEKLDNFNKHNFKHILSLPITTADPAVHILRNPTNRGYYSSTDTHLLWKYQQITRIVCRESAGGPPADSEDCGQ